VVIALHGYIDPTIYSTLDYTTGNADALARAGFLVIHPNLRGYPPSEDGENLFRVGMAIDVLNLIAIVDAQGGRAGPLEPARPDSIGLWGHSMGGGITSRVIAVHPRVRAAVLYGAMSGDERQNFEAINRWSNGERGNQELAVPEGELGRISPIYFLPRITAAVSIHHGEADDLVPLAWSLDTCARLTELGKDVECYTYPGQPHTFHDEGVELFNQRVIDFFETWLR
jgi:dipeptidyl aminopeptidase/acylaminoacyl peptidase